MFAILLYCKRFTAINYSLNLTFFYKFSAILLDCSLFLSGRTGCPEPRPEPDPNISPDWPEPDPEYRTIVRIPGSRYSGCEFGVQGILVVKASIIFTPNNCSFQGGCRRPPGRKANNYYQFWRRQVRPWAGVANNYSVS